MIEQVRLNTLTNLTRLTLSLTQQYLTLSYHGHVGLQKGCRNYPWLQGGSSQVYALRLSKGVTQRHQEFFEQSFIQMQNPVEQKGASDINKIIIRLLFVKLRHKNVIEFTSGEFGFIMVHYFCSILLFLIGGALASYIPSDGFSASQVTIWQGGTFPYSTNMSTVYLFNFALDSPPQNVQKAFAVPIGYSIQNNISLSFYTNLIFASSSALALQLNFYGDMRVYSMSFCIIATAPPSSPYLSVEEYVITPTILSDTNVTMNTTNAVLQYASLKSSLYFGHANFLIHPYITYFMGYNPIGPGIGIFFNNFTVNSNDFTLLMATYYNGQIFLVKTTVIIIDKTSLYDNNKLFFMSQSIIINYGFGPNNISLANLTNTTLAFPSQYGPKFSRNCSLGMSQFFTLPNGQKKQTLFSYSTSGFTDIQDQGTGFISVQIAICMISCARNEFYNTTSSQCELCSTVIKNCGNCKNSTFCTDCGINNIFDSTFNQCICIGQRVVGGCSNISYCTSIDSFTGICLSCAESFNLSADGKSCICVNGNLGMNGICVSIQGCITAAKINNELKCLACNTAANFRLSKIYSCDCDLGLSLVQGTCRPICGDGRLYQNEECDDGNNVDGDGCSSACLVETYYKCVNSSTTTPSDCYYIMRLKVKLAKIEKGDGNVAVFKFSFSPAPSFLSKINFSDSLTFATVPAHQPFSYAYSNGELTLSVPFEENFEGLTARLSIVLDRRLIAYNAYSLQFAMQSSNYPLVLFTHGGQVQSLKLYVRVVAAVAAVLFAVGSWAHRMIGVETVSALLFIYFSLGTRTASSELMFSPLAELRYVGNYGDVFTATLGTHSSTLDVLKLRTGYLENNFLLLIALIIGLLTFGLLILCSNRSKATKVSPQTICLQSKSSYLLFYCLLIPVSLGYFYQIFITSFFSLLQSNSSSLSRLENIFAIIALICSSLIVSSECAKIKFQNKKKRKQHDGYFIYFTINSMANAFILILATRWAVLLYLLAIQNLAYLIFLIIYRPYDSRLHFFSVVFNQVVTMAWLAILIMLQQSSVQDQTKLQLMYAEIFLLITVNILALIRIISQLYYFGSQRYKLTITQSSIKNGKKSIERLTSQNQPFHVEFLHSYKLQSIIKYLEKLQGSQNSQIFQERQVETDEQKKMLEHENKMTETLTKNQYRESLANEFEYSNFRKPNELSKHRELLQVKVKLKQSLIKFRSKAHIYGQQ